MQALEEAAAEHHLGTHLPGGEAGGVLVVGDEDALDPARLEVALRGHDAGEVLVVDRQEVDVLLDAGVQEVGAEVARPEAARELDLEVRIDRARGLGAGLADAKVGRDGIFALVARHDFVEPLPAPEAALVAARDRGHGLRPGVRVERRRLEGEVVHPDGQRPRRRALQADPGLQAGVGVRADRAVEAVEAPDVRKRLQTPPRGEVADVGEAEVGGEARGRGRADVRRAEGRRDAGLAPELRVGREDAEVLRVVAGLHRDGERAALVEARQVELGRAAVHGGDVEGLLGDDLAEDVAHGRDGARRALVDLVAPVDREGGRLPVLVHAEVGVRLDVEELGVGLEVHRAAAPVPGPCVAVGRDELQEEEAARAARAGKGPGELHLAVAGLDLLRLDAEAGDADVLALLVHDAVGIVDPRAERADADLRLPGAPGLGRIEAIAHLHRRDVAGILDDRRLARDPERALLERDGARADRIGGLADVDVDVTGVRVLAPVAAGREEDVEPRADGDADHLGLHLLVRVAEDERLADDGVERLVP